MYSQLIVVDFNKVHHPVDFEGLSGFTRDAISYYRDDLFDDFSAYLFNYERWGERPLLQVVFIFPEPGEQPDHLKAWVKQIDLKYREVGQCDLVVVEHREALTICGYVSLEKYPDHVNILTWLVEPPKEQDDAEPGTGEHATGTSEE